jgi:hypothetical protein
MAYSPCFKFSFSKRVQEVRLDETVDNVAGSGEYHWMAGNFLKFARKYIPAGKPAARPADPE